MQLVYICNPGEGPEPKMIGAPYGFCVTPGVPWECERDSKWIEDLCAAVPQIKIVNEPPNTEEQEHDGGEV